jgi:formylmethanofuran dehydrogenase subunit E
LWNYYILDETNDAKATCNECKKSICRGGKDGKAYNTSNLRKHLNSMHKEIFEKLIASELLAKEEEKIAQNKRKMSDFFMTTPKKMFKVQQVLEFLA